MALYFSYIMRDGIAQAGVYLDAHDAHDVCRELGADDPLHAYGVGTIYTNSAPAAVDYVQRLQRKQAAELRRVRVRASVAAYRAGTGR